jgi:hypothetical protein
VPTDDLVPVVLIENRILLIRGAKVLLDRDLALLYQPADRLASAGPPKSQAISG